MRARLALALALACTACSPSGPATGLGDTGDSADWSCQPTGSFAEEFEGDLEAEGWSAFRETVCGAEGGEASFDRECDLQRPYCLQSSGFTIGFDATLTCAYNCQVYAYLRRGGADGVDVASLRLLWQKDLYDHVEIADFVQPVLLGTMTKLDFGINSVSMNPIQHSYQLRYDHGIIDVFADGDPLLAGLRVADEDRILKADTLVLVLNDANSRGETRIDRLEVSVE